MFNLPQVCFLCCLPQNESCIYSDLLTVALDGLIRRNWHFSCGFAIFVHVHFFAVCSISATVGRTLPSEPNLMQRLFSVSLCNYYEIYASPLA